MQTDYRRSLIIILCIVLMAATGVFAQAGTPDSTAAPAKPRSKPMFGFKVGSIFGGKVNIENVDTLSSYEFIRNLEAGTSLGAYFEFSSPVWTTAGISLDLHRIKAENLDESKWMIDVGVVIKSSMRKPGQRFALRPLIGISYGYIPALEGRTTSGSFMVAKLGAETVYFPGSSRLGITLETCFIASPFGRAFSDDEDDRYDIAARPRPLVRLGVVFR
ncbi:MAG: hypothetical protein IPH75_15275 [bacterium]|nr:hypothetical protein [bacterium]